MQHEIVLDHYKLITKLEWLVESGVEWSNIKVITIHGYYHPAYLVAWVR